MGTPKKETVGTTLERLTVLKIDKLVGMGLAKNRSEFIRFCVRNAVNHIEKKLEDRNGI